MNNKLKNVFSFIKEALELKNKNIYDISEYEINLDFFEFAEKYKNLEKIRQLPEWNNVDINSDKVIFKMEYIKENEKRTYPPVPYKLAEFIELNDNNDIIRLIDNLEYELEKNNLLFDYKSYDKSIQEVNTYNDLIDRYNNQYMNFYKVYKRINDYEEKIEVILGNKLLVWNEKSSKIKRYILEANLEISVDSISNIISFKINKEKSRGFVTDFLNQDGYKVKERILLQEFINNFNDNIDEYEDDYSEEINKYINYISIENKIENCLYTGKINEKCTYLFENSGIIVRKKNIKLWIEDLESIINSCEKETLSDNILNLFGIDFSDEDEVKRLLEDSTYENTKDEEVLFPLPSNEEQFKIVDKVKSSNVVLVQGPPGTGKSHTITNLISHYISQGKKVVVTSEKYKALEVLREKLPQSIKNLSLTLFNSKVGDKELENSISEILKKQKDKQELYLISQQIKSLEEKLKNIRTEKQRNQRNILDLMSRDTISYKEKLKELIDCSFSKDITLMDIAFWLSENKSYDLVAENDVENYDYHNIKDFFESLDNLADTIKNEKYAISTTIPIINYLNNNEVDLHIKERNEFNNYIIQNIELKNSIKIGNLNSKILFNLQKNIDELSVLYSMFDKEWIKKHVEYDVFNKRISRILDDIEEKKEFIFEVENNLYDNIIKGYRGKEKIYLELINNILNLFDEKGNINIFNKIKLSLYVKKLEGLLFNNKVIKVDSITKNEYEIIKNELEYFYFLEQLKLNLKHIFEIDLFEYFNIQEGKFGMYFANIVKILEAFLEFENMVQEINSIIEKIINTRLFEFSYLSESEEKIKSILKDLEYVVNSEVLENKSLEYCRAFLQFYKEYNLQNIRALIASIESKDLQNYIKYKNLLIQEINTINKYNELKKIHSKFVYDKSNTIHKYIYDFSNDEKKIFKENIEIILKYHYVKKFYLALEAKGKQLPMLYEEREKLFREEKQIIKDLVTVRGWYYQNKNMTSEISVSLNKWVNFRKKLGAMTGKNSNSYLRKMREEMKTAKNAIPVWIMPIEKLIEQYPFSLKPQFDVLIMDESSQSSIFSISALARAKKIIIVGDDKQISPTDAFTNKELINDLRSKYLKNNEWDMFISKDTSIYDIIRTICGNNKVTLTEHFRCLPEIINYSNKEFYNMQINPLKVKSKENTINNPIREIYVPEAICKKNNSQVYNQKEIDRIVELISEISHDSQYENKTIGVITLQESQRYIQKLTELLMVKFGEKFIKERKIKVGNTYDFQGDERDVIILGMVISPILENGEKYNFRALTTKEFDRSFNVAASRAKEQMILVHSVKLEELSQNCNRYKLLNYCMTYKEEKNKEYEKLFESNFEKDIYRYLTSKGYNLVPQFKIGKYRLDFILVNENNQKIAIECDGDAYHGIEQLEYDLDRQTVLERCGWKFIRVRASEFYYNKDECTKKMLENIEYYLNNFSTVNVKASKTLQENKDNNHMIKKEDDNLNLSFDTTKHPLIYEETKSKINLTPSEFRYMILYSLGKSRTDISSICNVAYDTVKKALQSVAKKYNVSNVDECLEDFIKEFGDSKNYKIIVDVYKRNLR